jgi:hypothetical protein
MNSKIKNILAVIIGWIAGSIVNMSLITAGSKVFPIKGIDPDDMEAYAEIMPSLGSKHFIFPFLAHALGTLVGAAIAYLIATNHKMKFAFAIGVLFLLGGIAINYMLPGPIWFKATDILLAYIPMAWLGGKIAKKILVKK